MRDLDEIIDTLRRAEPDLKRRYPIRSLGIFGSYVRGEQTDASDLDILVEFEEPIGFFGFFELQEELSRTTGLRVDLVSRGELKSGIGSRILSEVAPL
jgi:uncharacterized protein